MRLDLWTLALQAINVLILVWLLGHFLYRPVTGIIAERRQAADALLAEAEAIRAKNAVDASELARQRQGLVAEGEHISEAARASGERERAAILQHAADAAARAQLEADKVIERERVMMRQALEREATELALSLAQRLLARLPAQALDRAFLQELGDSLASHPGRASLQGAPIVVRSAAPLDAGAQSDCRAMLQRLTGGIPEPVFRTDPAVLAGIELVSPELVIRNSWRTDLERLSRALQEDAGHDANVA